MKAFQLKIVIKNSKPPIWRRVIVPAGITFSQLSMILNKVMGWSGYHLFEFEFYHEELRVIEDIDEVCIGYGPFDYIEASSTYIKEYLENNEWFTYIYDFGDDWKHRVTIEKILEDYEYNFPQVIKYKGDCPVEDCGGIDGYYECLETIQDKTHPDYKERLEWMKSQGYPKKYDIDVVNSQLQIEYFYQWGKGETRHQNAIYEEHFSGNYGLKATKKDKNKDVKVNKSGKHQLEETMQMFKAAWDYENQWKEKMNQNSLKDIFSDFNKEDIVEIAKEKGVKEISKCNKDRLIDKLVDCMLQPEVMKNYFLCLHDKEIEEFEKAARKKGLYEPEKSSSMMNLYGAAYIGMVPDGRIEVPKEVVSIYNTFKGSEFEKERKKMSFLLCCLRAAVVLYGIVPFHVFMKLLDRDSSFSMSEAEVREKIKHIPPEFVDFVVVENKIYHDELYPNDRGLLRAQGNKEYYIPTKSEIIDLGTEGYLPNNKELKQFERYLIDELDAMEDEAAYAGRIIQMQISSDCKMQDIVNVLDDLGLSLENERALNDFANHINVLWNGTRMLLNRGFTPNELFVEEKKCLQPIPEKNKVIDFVQAKKNKIYPNDPCPCGSGKKYKNCCKK